MMSARTLHSLALPQTRLGLSIACQQILGACVPRPTQLPLDPTSPPATCLRHASTSQGDAPTEHASQSSHPKPAGPSLASLASLIPGGPHHHPGAAGPAAGSSAATPATPTGTPPTGPAQSPLQVDLFTQAMQHKTEQQLAQIIATSRAAQLAGQGSEAAAPGPNKQEGQEAEEDEPGEFVNPKTGEIMGPKGKEPTRYGDWEQKGRCTDF